MGTRGHTLRGRIMSGATVLSGSCQSAKQLVKTVCEGQPSMWGVQMLEPVGTEGTEGFSSPKQTTSTKDCQIVRKELQTHLKSAIRTQMLDTSKKA